MQARAGFAAFNLRTTAAKSFSELKTMHILGLVIILL